MFNTQTRFVPYYNNHKHKMILDNAVAKAVKMLTGRKAFTDTDRDALAMLGIGLVHVKDIDLSVSMAQKVKRGRPAKV